MVNLEIKLGRLKLKNPVMVASGTFGYAEEFASFMDLNKLGAIVTKTITLKPRKGNPMPRTCEVPAGMLNSIGLENPGLEVFIDKKLPSLAKIGAPIIVSIASEGSLDEFAVLAKELSKRKEVAGIELNISCPNVRSQESGVRSQEQKYKYSQLPTPNSQLISQDSKATYEVVKRVRKATKKTLITKLSPNVTDISEIALAAESGGSDAVSLINTLSGMSVDIDKRIPKIAMITAGFSGPAIRPVAVRMVWEVYKKINIPIIGMGGIIDARSALEFIIAGASCVSVGTANFINPAISIEIIQGIEAYLKKNKIKNIKTLIGSLKI